MLAWLPQLGRHTAPVAVADARAAASGIWRSPLAWQVTLFLGGNSFVYYVVTAWLPSILAASGYSAVEAGNLHGLLQLASALPGFILIPLGKRLHDQRPVTLVMSACIMVSLIGLMLWPMASLVWVPLFGFGTGAVFILGLAFVGTRVVTSQQAASLSAMAQSVGYLMAAAGPILVGRLHDLVGDWLMVLAICAAMSVAMGVLGMLAGRPGRVIAQPR